MTFFDDDIAIKNHGSLTNIPFVDKYFDIVYACESLEHAIDIDNAIQEMVRVTKSGGKIIIIDKNQKALGRMKIGDWEQWFDGDELKGIMQRFCTEVIIYKDIPYENKDADDLFYAWIGTVK